jgi:drug/metabolite transporter (DMT)-like permease
MGLKENFLNVKENMFPVKGRKVSMNIAIVYILISVLGGAVGQVLLKRGMSGMGPLTLSVNKLPSILFGMGTNPFVVIGLIVYVGSTVFWLTALSRVDLSYAYPFASLSYVAMLIASWQIFHEDISLLRLAGSFVILMGVILISRS